MSIIEKQDSLYLYNLWIPSENRYMSLERRSWIQFFATRKNVKAIIRLCELCDNVYYVISGKNYSVRNTDDFCIERYKYYGSLAESLTIGWSMNKIKNEIIRDNRVIVNIYTKTYGSIFDVEKLIPSNLIL